MLEEDVHNRKKIVLASTSPRRKEILGLLKLEFIAINPEDCTEKKLEDPAETAEQNSIIKAVNVYNRLKNEKRYKYLIEYPENTVLIAGFDTVVYLNGRFFGKPESKDQAFEFISSFSGRFHKVISGVCVLELNSGNYFFDSEVTRVKFRKLNGSQIRSYISRENVIDKAGAYNINGYGSLLVEKIEGCFFNAAGLPIFRFLGLLEKFDYKVL